MVKKRPNGCQSLEWGSCQVQNCLPTEKYKPESVVCNGDDVANVNDRAVSCKTSVFNKNVMSVVMKFKTRMFYNSKVKRAVVDSLLAKQSSCSRYKPVKTSVFVRSNNDIKTSTLQSERDLTQICVRNPDMTPISMRGNSQTQKEVTPVIETDNRRADTCGNDQVCTLRTNMADSSSKLPNPTFHVLYGTQHAGVEDKFVSLVINAHKTQEITIPRLKNEICLYAALCALNSLYDFSSATSLFQYKTSRGWSPVIDSRVRKTLRLINVDLGLHPGFYMFHSLHCSGATFAYNPHVPIQEIILHGTWSSDCVWFYIQSHHRSGENLARAMHDAINV